MVGGRNSRGNLASQLFWYLVMGLLYAAVALLGAGGGWLAGTLVGGLAVWAVDIVLPDPNGAWEWWESAIVWFQRGGAVLVGAIALGAFADQTGDRA